MSLNDSSGGHSNRQFNTTQWNLIRSIDDSNSNVASAALQELCQTYWYPLYAFVRHQGQSPDDAADLTQAFFADLLARKDLQKVRPEQGKFRAFLIAAIKHFMINEWKKLQTQKRGGGRQFFAIDYSDANQRYLNEPTHSNTSERMFERQWALTLLERTNQAIKEHFQSLGKQQQFEELRVFLSGKSSETTMRSAAERLGMTESAIKVAVHRMRHRFGALLRTEIEKTVDSSAEVDEEIKFLFGVLSGE